MPTSEAGSSGFSLLELLVVIAIVALATAGVGLAMRDPGQSSIDREADRLAALFESARAQSRASGATVRWRVTESGFAFDGLPPDALPSTWLDPATRAQPATPAGVATTALLLGPEPIIAPQQVVLSNEGPPARSLRVVTDGLRPFTVQPP